MTQYREILRLHKQGISGRSIASSLSCSRNTVSEVLQAAKVFGMEWPLPDTISDRELEEKLFPAKENDILRKMPDYDHIHKELSKSGVTLSLLWYEYSEECRHSQTIPYQYTQFCKYYNDYSLKTKATMRIHHKPSERLEVDWAGQSAVIQDNITGEPIKAYVFVAALPYSGYSYVEAFLSMNMESWIHSIQKLETACQRALSYTPNPSYRNVQAILKSGSDKLEGIQASERTSQSSEYGISRGAGYYGRADK